MKFKLEPKHMFSSQSGDHSPKKNCLADMLELIRLDAFQDRANQVNPKHSYGTPSGYQYLSVKNYLPKVVLLWWFEILHVVCVAGPDCFLLPKRAIRQLCQGPIVISPGGSCRNLQDYSTPKAPAPSRQNPIRSDGITCR